MLQVTRVVKKITTLIPIKFEVDAEIKSYVKSNLGFPLIISFIALLIFGTMSLIRGNSVFANELAIYTYYALVGGVALQIGSFLIRPKKQNNEKD